MSVLHRSQPCQPWNKGKLVGQKAPLKLKDIWAIRVRLQLRRKVRDRRCSTWQSIPNSVPAIWSDSEFLTCPMAVKWLPGPW